MNFKTRISEWLRGNSNVIIAALTLVLAVIAVIQARIYNSQLNMMRIDERPWISFKCPMQPDLHGGPLLQCLTVNTGKTPAKNVRGYRFFRTFPMTGDFDLIAPRDGQVSHHFSTNVLFPNEPARTLTPLMRAGDKGATEVVPWTKEMQDAYDRGDSYFEYHGMFTYEDIAGVTHWTQFCDILFNGQKLKFDLGMKCLNYNAVDDNK